MCIPNSAGGGQAGAVEGGFEELVRGDVMRAKFRNSYSRPEPLVPGKTTRVTFGMDDVLHTFKKGHRVMIQVQSSWFRWWIAIRRRSWTSTMRNRRTSGRRRSACIDQGRRRRESNCRYWRPEVCSRSFPDSLWRRRKPEPHDNEEKRSD